jgi:hypothetical protein
MMLMHVRIIRPGASIRSDRHLPRNDRSHFLRRKYLQPTDHRARRNSDLNSENREVVMMSLIARRYDMTSHHDAPIVDEYHLFQNR